MTSYHCNESAELKTYPQKT
uniref:Uncharacterized protein n=1 Tax=Rhizophora mucronata TaxID=61149 RepID=A0A2P2P957_RHIMU